MEKAPVGEGSPEKLVAANAPIVKSDKGQPLVRAFLPHEIQRIVRTDNRDRSRRIGWVQVKPIHVKQAL